MGIKKSKLTIKVYTDGACSGNPGPGGWAALILIKSSLNKKEKILIKGGEKDTTNNRMELQAVVDSLRFISKNLKNYKSKKISIYSDSSYVVNSSNGSLAKWNTNGWKTTKGTDVVNKDLWEELIILKKELKPMIHKVKGHDGNKFNEYVDKAAVKECSKFKTLLDTL